MPTEVTDVTIHLDASYDLWQAGEANHDAALADYTAAYRAAATYLGNRLGIHIAIVTDRSQPEDDFSEEWGDDQIWQRLHDATELTPSGWIVREDKLDASAAYIRSRLREEAPCES